MGEYPCRKVWQVDLLDQFIHSKISPRLGQFVKEMPEEIAVEVGTLGMKWAVNNELFVPVKYQTLQLTT